MELVYTPTRDDVVDAMRVRLRYGSIRWLLRLLPVCAVLILLLAALEVFGPGGPHLGSALRNAGFGLLFLALGPLLTRAAAGQMYPVIQRQGEHRARVDGDGVRWVTRESEVVGRWTLMSRYAETPTQFVLLSADKPGVGMGALPKRGLADPADIDRLRALLDSNATRL
ncbi:YcxB family protein [Streptomyces diastatochromogenes]|nr:YcxB family protein [Streptomyces diastatochromogenes]